MTNKQASITITLLSSALLALLVLIAARQNEPPIEPIPPEVNTEGLCVYEPVYKMYFTDADVVAVAEDVLTRWSLEKQGVAVNRELPKEYLFFNGYNDYCRYIR